MNRVPYGALGDLCDVSIGRTPRRSESRYWGGPHPWATIRDLDGTTLMATAQGITDDAVDEVMPMPVEPNTLLFSFKLTIGKMAFAGRRMHHNEAIAALPIRNPKVLNREFLFYALQAGTHDRGTNYAVLGKVLNKRKVEEIEIPLPPLDEQRRIVGVLNRAAKIERLRAQAADRLREFIPALFVRMFGDPVENPMHWLAATLGDTSEVQSGLQVTKKRRELPIEKPYLRVANVLRDRLDLNEVKNMRVTKREFERVRLARGDLLIVEGHGNASEIGRAALWDGSISDCLHQNHLIRVRLDHSMMLPEFACAYLNSPPGRQHLMRSGKTTSGLNTISTSNVKSLSLPVPPLSIQRHYVEIVEAARTSLSVAESGCGVSFELNNTLMNRLLAVD